jgi:hypothetical protein
LLMQDTSATFLIATAIWIETFVPKTSAQCGKGSSEKLRKFSDL